MFCFSLKWSTTWENIKQRPFNKSKFYFLAHSLCRLHWRLHLGFLIVVKHLVHFIFIKEGGFLSYESTPTPTPTIHSWQQQRSTFYPGMKDLFQLNDPTAKENVFKVGIKQSGRERAVLRQSLLCSLLQTRLVVKCDRPWVGQSHMYTRGSPVLLGRNPVQLTAVCSSWEPIKTQAKGDDAQQKLLSTALKGSRQDSETVFPHMHSHT